MICTFEAENRSMSRDLQLKERWEQLIQKLSVQFADGDTMELDAIIYLVGVQELGQIHNTFKKDEKLNLMQMDGPIMPLKRNYLH